jgi:hypothetical protein
VRSGSTSARLRSIRRDTLVSTVFCDQAMPTRSLVPSKRKSLMRTVYHPVLGGDEGDDLEVVVEGRAEKPKDVRSRSRPEPS